MAAPANQFFFSKQITEIINRNLILRTSRYVENTEVPKNEVNH